jgi:hypothetical protein
MRIPTINNNSNNNNDCSNFSKKFLIKNKNSKENLSFCSEQQHQKQQFWFDNRTQTSIKADRQIKEYFYHCIQNFDYPMRNNYCWDFSLNHQNLFRKKLSINSSKASNNANLNTNNKCECNNKRNLIQISKDYFDKKLRIHKKTIKQSISAPPPSLETRMVIYLVFVKTIAFTLLFIFHLNFCLNNLNSN